MKYSKPLISSLENKLFQLPNKWQMTSQQQNIYQCSKSAVARSPRRLNSRQASRNSPLLARLTSSNAQQYFCHILTWITEKAAFPKYIKIHLTAWFVRNFAEAVRLSNPKLMKFFQSDYV